VIKRRTAEAILLSFFIIKFNEKASKNYKKMLYNRQHLWYNLFCLRKGSSVSRTVEDAPTGMHRYPALGCTKIF